MLSESGTGTEAQQCAHSPPPHAVPSVFLPSSSPMRSSFQVQQNSINLIHPPMQSSGREPAASVWRISGVSVQQQQHNEPGGPVASCSFLQHVFCGASFKIASDQWGCRATERKRGQPISEGRGGGAKIKKQAVR